MVAECMVRQRSGLALPQWQKASHTAPSTPPPSQQVKHRPTAVVGASTASTAFSGSGIRCSRRNNLKGETWKIGPSMAA